MASDDDLTPRERAALTELTVSWSSQYDISFTPPSGWRAQRLDDPDEVYEAPTSAGLWAQIRQNYWPRRIGKPQEAP